jgi:hypothetical protein
MTSTRRPTKAEARRARVEAARAALARARRRSRNIRVAAWSAAVVVAVAVVVIVVVVLNRSPVPQTATAGPSMVTSAPTSAAGVQGRTSNPPWDVPVDTSAAVAAAGLPMLGAEGNAVHIHAHLDLIVNGAPVRVPADIGVDDARQKISPLHSHDTSGVIHIESPTAPATFTLGQFFVEWQVSLAADHVGGLVVDDTHQLKVYVNGRLYTGDPAAIVLAVHDEIAIVYGTPVQQTSVPGTYQWTNGL